MADSGAIVCGSFELIEPVGSGGVATVWRGRHRRRDLPVAVKVITGANARDPAYHEGFRREVQAHAGLDHPGIVTVFEYGKISADAARASNAELAADSPYFALEFAGAGTLREQSRIDNWPLLRSLFLEVLDALAYAHARRVIHRDLKPENILYFPGSQAGRFKLSDFGIAHSIDSKVGVRTDKVTDANAGTPHYMPPEQLRGEWREFGPWTDLYALGCMAFEFIHGSLPFDAGNLSAVAIQQIKEEPPDLEPQLAVPDGIEEWIRRLLAKEPRRRFQRAADAAWALRRLPARVDEQGDEAERLPDSLTARAPTVDAEDLPATEVSSSTIHAWESNRRPSDDADDSVPIAEQPTQLLGEPGAPRMKTLAAQSTDQIFGNDGEADGDPTGGRLADHTGGDRPPPPLPGSWRFQLDRAHSTQFVEAGLELFALREVPLVGRDEERDAIWTDLRDVYDHGRLRVVEVRGEAGIGKSRLAEWIARRTHELGGATTLQATHSRQGGPTEGLAAMLESALNVWELDRRETYRHVLDELGELYPDDYRDVRSLEDEARALTEIIYPTPGGIPDVDGPRYHFRSSRERFAVVTRLLRHLSRERPVVMIVDDVQWGRDAVGLVEHMLEVEADLPVFVLMTLRSESVEGESPTGQLLEAIRRRSAQRTIELEALDEEARRGLVDRLLPLESELAGRVAERTDGIPLFTVQLLSDWIEREVLTAVEGGFATDERVEAATPGNIGELWEARIEQTVAAVGGDAADRHRRALELAAALGPHVDLEEWRAVCRRANVPADDALYERLIREGLAWPEAQGWSFVHPLLVERLEQQARRADRWVEHNLHCGATLAYLYADANHRIERRRVEHLIEAGHLEEALDPTFALVRHYERTEQYDQLKYVLARRRLLLDEVGLPDSARRRIENRRTLAFAHLHTGEVDRAAQLLDGIRQGAKWGGWTEESGEAELLEAAIGQRRGDLEGAREALDRAESHFQQAGAESGCARVEIERGSIARQSGDFEGARAAYERAEDLLEVLDRPGDVIELHIDIGRTALADGDDEAALDRFYRAFDRAKELGIDSLKARALLGAGDTYRHGREVAEAREAYRDALQLLGDIDPVAADFCRLNLAHVERLADEEAKSGHWLADIDEGRRPFAPELEALVDCSLAAGRGDWEAWEEAYARFEEVAPETVGAVGRRRAWLAELVGMRAEQAGEGVRARLALDYAAGCWEAMGRPRRAAACRRDYSKV